MIRMAAAYRPAPIELFDAEDTGKTMGQGQAGQRPDKLCAFTAGFRHSVRPADYKSDIAAVGLPGLEPFCQTLAGQRVTALVEQDQLLVAGNTSEYGLTLDLDCACRPVAFGPASRRQLIDAKSPLGRQPLHVAPDCRSHPLGLSIAYRDQADVHVLHVGRREVAGRRQRPQLFEIVELTHARQHDVDQCVFEIE